MTLIKDILYGKAIGDALGVPVECTKREILAKSPITGMRGHGAYNQVKGTWSDDTSMALAIADSLAECKGVYSLDDIAAKFLEWAFNNKYTAHGNVFDIGGTTIKALNNLKGGASPLQSGLMDLNSQSNGSLMRTLALLPYLLDKPVDEVYRIVSEVSAITHNTFACKFACFFLIEYALTLLEYRNKPIKYVTLPMTALVFGQDKVLTFISEHQMTDEGLNLFNIGLGDMEKLTEHNISSGGYCVDTLIASIWCLIETKTYKDAVLKAVNLGGDTDTTAAVTGALAGIVYGFDSIPKEWVEDLANKPLIDSIVEKYDVIENRLD
jgi:ADP-ribosylglycohydrolase